jgi:hypothetical protein
MTQTVKDPAKAAIKVIQTRRRQVPGLAEDETWRDFLAAATKGERSLRAMDAGQLAKVADALTRAGAPTGPGRSAALLPRDPQSRKLRALWIIMGKAGVVKDRREKALCAWCARQLSLPKLDSLSFLNPQQRGHCIDDLTQWAKSKGVTV